jgi:signal transduction histidine kinase
MSSSELESAADGQLARLAHELNNPLDGVLRYVALAARVAGPDAQAYLSAARGGLLRMAGILRGAVTAGSAGVAPVGTLLADAVEAMRPRADAAGVAIACRGDARGAAAGAELYQVFCNIIKNALDAMPSGGRLDISLAAGGGEVAIEFADSGCGLGADGERLFEPGFTTKPLTGAGLGLAICRELLERLGGSIDARPGLSGGSVFEVRVPLAQCGRAAGEERHAARCG